MLNQVVSKALTRPALALTVAPGREGLISAHNLASAVNQPQQTFGGVELYPTVPEKAAACGFFLAEGQAFEDGNKRTAVITMLVFLDLNGFEFLETDDEMERVFIDLAKGVIDQGEFFGWVCNHASEVDG